MLREECDSTLPSSQHNPHLCVSQFFYKKNYIFCFHSSSRLCLGGEARNMKNLNNSYLLTHHLRGEERKKMKNRRRRGISFKAHSHGARIEYENLEKEEEVRIINKSGQRVIVGGCCEVLCYKATSIYQILRYFAFPSLTRSFEKFKLNALTFFDRLQFFI